MEHKRWVCPQCFTSVRGVVLAHREKPINKCPDHFNLDWVEIATHPGEEISKEAKYEP
jgi:hypothetical protein